MLLLLPRLVHLVGPPRCCRACGTHKLSGYCGDQRSMLTAGGACSAAGGELRKFHPPRAARLLEKNGPSVGGKGATFQLQDDPNFFSMGKPKL